MEELLKKILTCNAKELRELSKQGLIDKIIPEWKRIRKDKTGWQHLAHEFRLDEHTLKLIDYLETRKEYLDLNLENKKIVRMASLLHDIAKKTCHIKDRKNHNPDFDHPITSAKMSEKILTRLNYPKKKIDMIVKLVLHHKSVGDIAVHGEESPKTRYSKEELAKLLSEKELNFLLLINQADSYSVKNDDYLEKTNNSVSKKRVEQGLNKVTTKEAMELVTEEIIKLIK